MTVEFACLASMEALFAAPPDEIAAAVLWVGLKGAAEHPVGQHFIDVRDVDNVMARSMGLTAAKASSMDWMRWLRIHPNSELPSVVKEGIIFAEQRLCIARHWSSSGFESVVLLRRGRDAILSGDPFKYLRTS